MFAPISHNRRRACDNSNSGPRIGGDFTENPLINIANISGLFLTVKTRSGEVRDYLNTCTIVKSALACPPLLTSCIVLGVTETDR